MPPHTPDHTLVRIPTLSVERIGSAEAAAAAGAGLGMGTVAGQGVVGGGGPGAGGVGGEGREAGSPSAAEEGDGVMGGGGMLQPMVDSEGEEDVMLAMAVAMLSGHDDLGQARAVCATKLCCRCPLQGTYCIRNGNAVK